MPFLHENEVVVKQIGVAVGFILLIVMAVLTQKDWGDLAQGLCVIYAIATTVFFFAQLWGFVISQTQYSDEVEEPKFQMLENEEKEWNRSLRS